ncbi:MAG: EamA family transporter [Gammaproteobacteria bacterium]|nr:EamA family transporter [Gammaproteobacteria bacterium]
MSSSARGAARYSLHSVGVLCGLAAGAWLGSAEAPTKLVTIGFSPFIVSLGMVMGVFVARWTVPVALKGTSFVWQDLREAPHLIIWAILAGMLWAVANTLTVFAIRDVGLSIAFPLWNMNSLVGVFWGWLLFNELRGGAARARLKVLAGAAAIVVGACVLAYVTSADGAHGGTGSSALGVSAALGAALLWGTMYIPYRKAYLSGMNPLSFVTVFTVGELVTVFVLAAAFGGGTGGVLVSLRQAEPALLWLFLGGFCWVLGDLFQQYAAKYVGISRGIPLSNTNQLWGLAWGVLVFGELGNLSATSRALVVVGSLVMIGGALLISLAEAAPEEQREWEAATARECGRYGLDPGRVAAALKGSASSISRGPWRWWEVLIVAAAVAVFVWLALHAQAQALVVNVRWLTVLTAAALALLLGGGFALWKRTRFC